MGKKIGEKQKFLNKIFSTGIIKLLSMPTMDGTKLTCGEAEKVLEHTLHLLRSEMKKEEVKDNIGYSEYLGFEIRSLSKEEWRKKINEKGE